MKQEKPLPVSTIRHFLKQNPSMKKQQNNKKILRNGPLSIDNLTGEIKDPFSSTPFSINDFNLDENISMNNKLDNYLRDNILN